MFAKPAVLSLVNSQNGVTGQNKEYRIMARMVCQSQNTKYRRLTKIQNAEYWQEW